MQAVEIGYVNTVDKAKGMATVSFTSKGTDKITSLMPVCRFGNEYWMPQIGEQVAVLWTGLGASQGIIIGTYWNDTRLPPVQDGFYKDTGNGTYIKQAGGRLELKDAGGSISITDLMQRLASAERRISSLESRI